MNNFLQRNTDVEKKMSKISTLKAKIKTRMGLAATVWILGLSAIVALAVSIGHINETLELTTMIISTFICKYGI